MLWNAERENDSVQNVCVHARKELIYDYAISGNIKLHGKGGGGTSYIIRPRRIDKSFHGFPTRRRVCGGGKKNK